MIAFDGIVVGQGLAGTALTWHLRWRGRRVLTLDREEPITPSRIAAGLLTPITGQRLVSTWRLADCWPAAVAFYRRVEAEVGVRFFHENGAVRFFADAAERDRIDRRTDPTFRTLVRTPATFDALTFAAPHGGFEMPTAAQVDVPAYLAASRARFGRDDSYLAVSLDPGRDIELTPTGVRIPRLGVAASEFHFCDGTSAADNPWLSDLRFNPAAGEILTVRVPGLNERRVVHRGVWLAPVGGDLFRTGSTYRWDDLRPVPTATGRDEITAKLRAFLRLPFEVVGHEAALRPVLVGGRPFAGRHPAHPQLGFLNGLGSKGALLAPTFAAQLAG
jgi:glycine/D-amino acid oxidase-like deaminating enzyme